MQYNALSSKLPGFQELNTSAYFSHLNQLCNLQFTALTYASVYMHGS